MAADSTLAQAGGAELVLSQQDAALLLEAIKALRNCHKYGFRDERASGTDPTLTALDELAERIRATLGAR